MIMHMERIQSNSTDLLEPMVVRAKCRNANHPPKLCENKGTVGHFLGLLASVLRKKTMHKSIQEKGYSLPLENAFRLIKMPLFSYYWSSLPV